MKAIILAAGKSSRLYPITLNKPKCLLNVHGKKLIEHQIELLRLCGIDNILVVTGYLHEKIEKILGEKVRYKYYDRYKKACDEYFYLPHRSEARGEGGIFIDHLKTDNWNNDFNFIKDVGLSTLKAITTIIKNLKDEEWSEEEKEQQLIKRGRYVEFNLLWDRGTAFGIKTGGNSDAILMSMPPNAKWD